MRTNPPWGHVNTFDEARLAALFPGCSPRRVSFVGRTRECTNAVAARLMDFAGNPYGTYEQDEPCVHCGRPLIAPPERDLIRKVATRFGFWAGGVTRALARPRPNWVHMLLSRGRPAPAPRLGGFHQRMPA
jgi:hypothetical protein